MRYIVAMLGLLLASLPAFSHDNNTILSQLTEQLSLLGFLPGAVQTTAPTRLKIIYLPDGVRARWNPKTDTFEVSKTQWKNSPHTRCLLPLFVHESIHSHFVKQARIMGFAWPITLQDEVPATYYELLTENTQPEDAQHCAGWRAQIGPERRAFAAQNWLAFQTAIYERYSQFLGNELPPPPFAQPWTTQAKKGKELTFYQHIYPLRRRNVSAEKFWRKGGSWLRLSPKELSRAQQDPRYPIYKNMLQQFFSK